MGNLIPGNPASEESIITESVAYQTAMYLPLPKITKEVGKDPSINEIIEYCNSPKVYELDTWGNDEKVALATLRDIVAKNPDLGQSRLTNPSWEKPSTYPVVGMQACVFVNSKNEQIVSFRGTPSGSWLDNAKEMMGLPPEQSGCEIFTDADGNDFVVSPMQKKALEYVRDVVLAEDPDKMVRMCGHSKGGNETQMAAIIFANNVISACSLDGQGVSQRTMDLCLQYWGEKEFQERRSKILSISASGDYVHRLGNSLALPENTLHVWSNMDPRAVYMGHYIHVMVEDGKLTPVTEEGSVSKLVEKLSNDLLALPPNERRRACLAVMSLFQKFLAKHDPVGGDSPPLTDKFYGSITALSTATLGMMSSEGVNFVIDWAIWAQKLGKALDDHDYNSEEDILNYLKEHTSSGNLEYLVRGATLQCRFGSAPRKLNLRKDHGVYITTHPVVHWLNCDAGEEQNIPPFGICSVTGSKCEAVIIGAQWKDSYQKTRIVDNGEKNPGDRAIAEQTGENAADPVGEESITTLSFLVCGLGGLIEPKSSGQEDTGDPEEAGNGVKPADGQEDSQCKGAENLMHEKAGDGDIHGSGYDDGTATQGTTNLPVYHKEETLTEINNPEMRQYEQLMKDYYSLPPELRATLQPPTPPFPVDTDFNSDVMERTLKNDTWVRQVSAELGVPEAYLRTALFAKENSVHASEDISAMEFQEAYQYQKLLEDYNSLPPEQRAFLSPPTPPLRDMTGIPVGTNQIDVRTAIDNINAAIAQGSLNSSYLDIPDSVNLDINDKNHCRYIWERLQENPKFNMQVQGLIIQNKAKSISPNKSLDQFTQDEKERLYTQLAGKSLADECLYWDEVFSKYQ